MEPGGAQPLIAAPRHLPVLGPPARPDAPRVAPRRPFPWPAFPCGPPSCPHADPRPPPRAASCAPFRATSSERAASVAYFGRLRGAASPHPLPPDVGYVCYLWPAKMGQHQCLRFYTGDAAVSRVYPHSLESRVVSSPLLSGEFATKTLSNVEECSRTRRRTGGAAAVHKAAPGPPTHVGSLWAPASALPVERWAAEPT